MDSNEWCGIVHIDVGGRVALEEAEQMLRELVVGTRQEPGAIEFSVLRSATRPNHFEAIGRYLSETAYLGHLVMQSNLTFRSRIAALLASPYEERLYGPGGGQTWPKARASDAIVVTEFEIHPAQLAHARDLIDEICARQQAAVAIVGQARLERRIRPNCLAIISAWPSITAFDDQVGSESMQLAREALAPLLIAPIDDRQYQLFAGEWTAR